MKSKKTETQKKSIRDLIIQFIKFGFVGALNTGVDFIVLNVLLWISNTYSGPMVIVFNAISFTAAVINSYFLNKYWTFQNTQKNAAAQFGKFLFVSLIGLILNTLTVYGISTYIEPLFGLEQELWANVAKLVATFVALGWNFVGYKLWAFKEQS